jgi:uncharacterized SAM-binding protein YcdF (DUF218 family)
VNLAILFVALTVVLFIHPPTDDVARVDAVVVLPGDRGERLAKGVEMMRNGVAPTLVYPGIPDSERLIALCSERQSFEVVCLRPVPDNTTTEAQAVGELSAGRQWRSIAVVTSSPHVTRARILFHRCVAGDVNMVDAEQTLSGREWLHLMTDEWAKVLYTVALDLRC